MLEYVFPIVLIVISNIAYNICQKTTPQDVNPFSALLITYTTAAVLTVLAGFLYKTDKSFLHSFAKLNWTSFVLGLAIVGLEVGYLMAYRVGWNIGVGSLVANIILAVMLIPIGILFFNEGFTFYQIFGALMCICGLILINK
ncbi:EamA-like transporter family [Desulfosporosinus acidiphilus SJ4]|uniref:EamA-like transporter family n=1 Tax=Desulfosporosinus acidiphilus (strain DSM 22704 / JCM 16185 / SJ4) TaxID=646529 RepID=I4D2U6_DESAJ|nr:EamA family transporter [Desulfosporosinus acidiphilus]AFM40120.1 EamA-like transporter family [Desulfosporosinus acidiphilus SJ4]